MWSVIWVPLGILVLCFLWIFGKTLWEAIRDARKPYPHIPKGDHRPTWDKQDMVDTEWRREARIRHERAEELRAAARARMEQTSSTD